jgi:hypothetical protein
MNNGTRRGGVRGQRHAPAALYPRGKTRYPLYRGLGGPHGRSGQVRKISPPPGFDPRAVQPVASRYKDYATRPTGHTADENIIWHMRCAYWITKAINTHSVYVILIAFARQQWLTERNPMFRSYLYCLSCLIFI